MEVEDERAVKKLKFRVQPVAEDEDTVTGEEIIDLAMLEKDCERLENLGLTLTESKEIMGTLQQHVLARQTDAFVDERRHCSGCGRVLPPHAPPLTAGRGPASAGRPGATSKNDSKRFAKTDIPSEAYAKRSRF